jgi:hypothetical protein
MATGYTEMKGKTRVGVDWFGIIVVIGADLVISHKIEKNSKNSSMKFTVTWGLPWHLISSSVLALNNSKKPLLCRRTKVLREKLYPDELNS